MIFSNGYCAVLSIFLILTCAVLAFVSSALYATDQNQLHPRLTGGARRWYGAVLERSECSQLSFSRRQMTTQFRPLMRPRTTLLGVTFASSLHSFGMQTSEFRPRGAGALGGIKGRLGLSLEVGHDVADDQLEGLCDLPPVRPLLAGQP